MADEDKTLKLIRQSFEQTNQSRKRFEELDNEANASAVSILQSAAELAKAKPDEFFGLKPSESQKYFVENVLVPLLRVQAAANSDPVEDIDGSMPLPAWLGPLLADAGLDILKDLLKDFFGGGENGGGGGGGGGSGGIGKDLIKWLLELFKKEKEYFLGMDKQSGDRAGGTRPRQA